MGFSIQGSQNHRRQDADGFRVKISQVSSHTLQSLDYGTLGSGVFMEFGSHQLISIRCLRWYYPCCCPYSGGHPQFKRGIPNGLTPSQ